MTTTLTQRQSDVFSFIQEQCDRRRPPTIREIGERFGIKSPNGVMAHLNALEMKGFIARDRNESRGIMLLKGGRGIPYFSSPEVLVEAMK